MSTMKDWLAASPERQRLFAEERLIALAAEEIWAAMERGNNTSQADLAKSLGKSKAYVSQLLNGARNMTLRTLAGIAEALGSNVELRLRNKHVHEHWQPMDGGMHMAKLRPDAAIRYTCQNDADCQGTDARAA